MVTEFTARVHAPLKLKDVHSTYIRIPSQEQYIILDILPITEKVANFICT